MIKNEGLKFTRISLMLPADDVEWIDEQAKNGAKSRAAIMRDIIKNARESADAEEVRRIADKTLAEIKELFFDKSRQDEWEAWIGALDHASVAKVLNFVKHCSG